MVEAQPSNSLCVHGVCSCSMRLCVVFLSLSLFLSLLCGPQIYIIRKLPVSLFSFLTSWQPTVLELDQAYSILPIQALILPCALLVHKGWNKYFCFLLLPAATRFVSNYQLVNFWWKKLEFNIQDWILCAGFNSFTTLLVSFSIKSCGHWVQEIHTKLHMR